MPARPAARANSSGSGSGCLPRGSRRRREVAVDVEKARTRNVTAEIELATVVRFPELPAAIDELVLHLDAREDSPCCHPAALLVSGARWYARRRAASPSLRSACASLRASRRFVPPPTPARSQQQAGSPHSNEGCTPCNRQPITSAANVTPAASASLPMRAAALRARSSTGCSKGWRGCAIAARSAPIV